jgi:molybdate transport system substrate-binding protein
VKSARVACLAAVSTLAPACTRAAEPSASPILVFAAASLSAAFESMKEPFQVAHPATRLEINFAGTPQLVAQVEEGAPADVFAPADEPSMKRLIDGGFTAGPARTFARNRLEIVVEAGNPRKLAGLADLSRPQLKVALCAPAVPAGSYAREALGKADVAVSPASEEPNVKAIVSKVGLGEIDAGIVYATDVKAGGARVSGVAIPEAQNVDAAYPIAALQGGKNPSGGRAFADFVVSREGQRVLAAHGFRGP